MSSRAGTPLDDDSLSDVFGAMAQSSPIAPPRGEKRLHSTLDGDGDSDDNILDNGSGAPQIPVTVNENISAAATRYMERKRLKPDQKAEVNAFLHVSRFPHLIFLTDILFQDPASIREVKLLVNLMVVQSQIDKIITTTAPWQPSEDLLVGLHLNRIQLLISTRKTSITLLPLSSCPVKFAPTKARHPQILSS
jgi:hypothetical protein